MKVNITSVHFKADKKLENFIERKVTKLTGKIDGVIGSEVTLKLESSETHDNKIAEIRLFIKGMTCLNLGGRLVNCGSLAEEGGLEPPTS